MADPIDGAQPVAQQQQQPQGLTPEEEQMVIQAFGMFVVGHALALQNELKSSIND
jgi:hypothetical protein